MDDRTFRRRCLYVAVTILALALIFSMMWNIKLILGVCGAMLGKLFYYISPLLYAFIIAYLLFIPVSNLEILLKKNQWIARRSPKVLRIVTIVLTYAAALAVIGVIFFSIYLMIGGQLSRNTGIQQIIDYIVSYLSGFRFGDLRLDQYPAFKELVGSVEDWMQNYASSLVSDMGATVSSISSAVVIGVLSLIISIYFLMDYEQLVARIRKIYMEGFGRTVPGNRIYQGVRIFDGTFKQFLKGQLLEACLVAGLSVIALKIAGVSYFGIIGIIAGICNLIPFVGPWIGAVVAVLVSLLGGGYMTALWAIVAMVIVQQVDNHLLAPKIVGDSVGLHPVITMVVLIIGADVGGLAGMLLAVPTAATIKNIILYAKEQRSAAEGEEDRIPEK